MSINLARLDLVSIRLAVLCAEAGSLSAASKRAHVSLSSGSHRLTALEEALGARLFSRESRGLRTTAAGEFFVKRARTILREVEMLHQDGLVESQ